MDTPANRRLRLPSSSPNRLTKKAQCSPETANRCDRPAWDIAVSSSTDKPLRSPVSSAVTNAAVVPSSQMAAIFSRMARAIRCGSHRRFPALPCSTAASSWTYSKANTPREVNVVTSFSWMRPASCHLARPVILCPGSKAARDASP